MRLIKKKQKFCPWDFQLGQSETGLLSWNLNFILCILTLT